MKIHINGFRSFRDATDIELKPITILIGENSAGKSSCMAAIRYVTELFATKGSPSFNQAPFFLGSWKELVFSPRSSSADQGTFSLGLTTNVNARRMALLNRPKEKSFTATATALFGPRNSQPMIERLNFSVPAGTLEIENLAADESTRVTVKSDSLEQSELSNRPIFQYLTINGSVGLFPYLAAQVFREAHRDTKPANALAHEAPPVVALSDEIAEQIISLTDSNKLVQALSASRANPIRTYNPVDSSPHDPDGSHAIFRLARYYREQGESWKKVVAIINAFGRKSGAFESMNVRSLGRSDADPFQIRFRTGGRSSNMLDVGFGVSQILPVLFDLIEAKYNVFMVQQPEAHLHPRAQATFGQLLCELKPPAGQFAVVETHSDYILDSVRISVRDGVIKNSDVAIYFFHREGNRSLVEQIELDEIGNVSTQSTAFQSFFLNHNSIVLGAKHLERIL